MIFLRAFLVGGAICAVVQVVINKTKVTPGRIMVSLVCIGVVLGAIGIYEPFSQWAGCGATVPLIGFGNNLWKGMKDAIDESGVLGLFKGGFTSSAVGISGALIFGYLASLIFKSKMQ
jgi:stage V sporulation protein AE